MNNKPEKIDLILAYTYFRESNQYLNIIKALSAEFSIGILEILTPNSDQNAEHTNKQREKVIETDHLTLELCQSLGAKLLSPENQYQCQLLIVPHNLTSPEALKHIVYKKAIALERFGSGPRRISKLQDNGINEIWVLSKKVFAAIVAARPEIPMPDNFKVVEVGTPYKKYPAFDFSELEIDYIIAYPTLMLIKDLAKRCDLFTNIRKLIRSLPREAKIALKPHNVKDQKDEPGKLDFLNKMPRCLCDILLCMVKILFKLFPSSLPESAPGQKLLRLQEILLIMEIESRSFLLSEKTIYSNFGLEHFLPFIKKGIITGISSCLWHSLYNRIPLYNCDDQPLTEEMPNVEVYRAFYIPPCHGKLVFDELNYDLIDKTTRQADLIENIRGSLS